MSGGNGCPPGAGLCDQFVDIDWVDVVLVVLLAVCAAVGLIDLTRRVLSRRRR